MDSFLAAHMSVRVSFSLRFCAALAIFHTAEFGFVAVYHPRQLSIDSFLLSNTLSSTFGVI